jgi:hypothetical protein
MKLVDEPFLAANEKLQVMQRLELAIDRGAGVISAHVFGLSDAQLRQIEKS